MKMKFRVCWASTSIAVYANRKDAEAHCIATRAAFPGVANQIHIKIEQAEANDNA